MRKLSDDVKIDRNNLPDEWEKHPGISEYWSEQWLNAWAEKDQAKIQLDAITDDLELKIRNDPKSYGVGKITDKAIVNCVKSQVEYKNAVTNLHEKSKYYNQMQIATKKIEERLKCLENLTKLELSGIYTCSGKPSQSLINEVNKYRPPINRRN
jgi:hypothetical protein